MTDSGSPAISHKRVSVKARQYLVGLGVGYHEVTPAAKGQIRDRVRNRFPVYPGSFDMIKLHAQCGSSPLQSLTEQQLDALTLVEVKASDRNLPDSLDGYFFSFQYAEQLMAQALGDRYKILFVVLPRGGSAPFHKELKVNEIWAKARTIHMQWSIKF